jgi:hypothetical protein
MPCAGNASVAVNACRAGGMPCAGNASVAVNACRAGGMPCAGNASVAVNACRAGGMPCAGNASVAVSEYSLCCRTYEVNLLGELALMQLSSCGETAGNAVARCSVLPLDGCKAAIETLKSFKKFTRRVKRESMSVIYDFFSFRLC